MAKSSKRAKTADASLIQSSSSVDIAAAKVAPGSFEKLISKLKRIKGVIVAIAGVGAVASGFVGYYTTYKTVSTVQAKTAASAAAASSSGSAAVNPLSIIVLPFANQTGDAKKAYIADALTSSISADLNRIRDAFVVPTATAFSYKDKAMTVQQVGKDAAVRFVLHGSVLASGEQLRISVQLADSFTGKQLWNETFEGNIAKLFELQDLVTTRIGNSIGNEMVIEAARESEKRSTKPKVAELILRVGALRTKPQSVVNLKQQEAWLRDALRQEPENARALADLAATLAVHASNYIDDDDPTQKTLLVEAQALALRAKAIDDTLAGIYVALSHHASGVLHDEQAARRYAEKRLALEPKSPSAYNNLSIYYHSAGEPQKAIELLNKGLALYPKGIAAIFANLCNNYLMLGDSAAAIEWGQKTMDLDDRVPPCMVMAYSNLGQIEKARLYAHEYKRQLKENGNKNSIPSLDGTEPAAYAKYFNERRLPEWKKAGLLD